MRSGSASVVGALEGIGTQVEELWKAQCYERILPDIEAVCSLLGEDQLPLVVAQCHQRAVVVEVEEFLAWGRPFAGSYSGGGGLSRGTYDSSRYSGSFNSSRQSELNRSYNARTSGYQNYNNRSSASRQPMGGRSMQRRRR